MTTQLALFGETPDHNCVRDGPCRTCGATRPDGYTRTMWLEPVSLECLECNHRTLAEMFGGDPQTKAAAWERHHYSVSGRKRKRR